MAITLEDFINAIEDSQHFKISSHQVFPDSEDNDLIHVLFWVEAKSDREWIADVISDAIWNHRDEIKQAIRYEILDRTSLMEKALKRGDEDG